MVITRLKLLLDESTERELIKRSNYVGVSISSIVLLHLVLYSDSTIVKRSDFDYLQDIKKRSLQLDIKDYVLERYDEKPRYNNSLYLFLSVFLEKIVHNTKVEWEEINSNVKQEMNFSTYSIEENVVGKMRKFKHATGLTYTTIINYAALMKIDKKLSFFDNGISRSMQGFQLSDAVLIKIETEAKSLNVSVGNLLENKLGKLLLSLDI